MRRLLLILPLLAACAEPAPMRPPPIATVPPGTGAEARLPPVAGGPLPLAPYNGLGVRQDMAVQPPDLYPGFSGR